MQTDLTSASTAYREGRWNLSRNQFEKALRDAEADGKQTGTFKYSLLLWLATIDLDLGHPNSAKQFLDQAAELADKTLPEQDKPDPAYTNARWNVVARNYSLAQELCQSQLNDTISSKGRDSEEASDALLDLGRILYFSGRYHEAEEPLRKSLAIRKRIYGDKHLKYAQPLQYLAANYLGQDNRAAAEPLCKVALSIVQKELPPTHVQVAENLHWLALLKQRAFKHEEAEELWTRALSIAQEVLPDNHPLLAKILCGLGTAKTSNYRFKEAEDVLHRSLKAAENAEALNQLDVLTSLLALGMYYFSDHQYEKAEPCLRRAIDMWERHSELANFGERSVLENLTVTYFFQGKFIDAMRLFPNIMRARYTSNFQSLFALIETLAKLAQRAWDKNDV
jgi:tetratricopeptide (TPR) repeat protein